MEPLFRFVLTRPPVAQDPENPSIQLTQDSPYQVVLRRLEGSGNRRALKELAMRLIESEEFVGTPESTPLHEELAALEKALDGLEQQETINPEDLGDAIMASFNAEAADLVEKDAFTMALTRLRDSLTAIKQIPAEHARPVEALTQQLRSLEVIVKSAQDEAFPANAQALRRFRRRSVELPSKNRLPSVLSLTDEQHSDARKARENAESMHRASVEGLLGHHRELTRALTELTRMGADNFETTPLETMENRDPMRGLELEGMLRQRALFSEKLSDLQVRHWERVLDAPPREGGDTRTLSPLSDQTDTEKRRSLASAGSPAITAAQFRKEGLRLTQEAIGKLSTETRKVLAAQTLSGERDGMEKIVADLAQARLAVQRELQATIGPMVERKFARVGNTLVATKTIKASHWASLVDGIGALPAFIPFPGSGSVPSTRGKVEPAGIADLLMVRQQLIGYERADVAHIENVLKGERKEREHTTRRETEQVTFMETEVSTSEERELETTDRFEMTRESGETIKEDAALKAGLTVTGKYGPTVEFTASAEGSMSRSKEAATKTASSFSQDVTQRSSNKISERVLKRTSLRITNEVTEKNSHLLDNVAGTGHIAGVYQWVNKIYRAQMFNYGLRTMFDFMVPEPAAFLIKAMQSAHDSVVELEKPEEFTVTPAQITETNYGHWVSAYAATDVAPPPEMYRTTSADFKAFDEEPPTFLNHSGQIAIDEGYEAIKAYLGTLVFYWEENWALFIVVGDNFRQVGLKPDKSYTTMQTLTMSHETGSVPFALITNRVANVGLTIEIKSRRTELAMQKWRAETHAKLVTAYRARLSEYEEKLANIEIQAGIAIRGANPALNLERMKDELKKDCISMLTDQHYDLFNAIDNAPSTGLPQIDVSEAAKEGSYVRFFEQAFEWEHLTWITYPYFWGRKSEWEDRMAFDDPDPLFTQFLKAGYCRVSVPARPGFEGAIDHFMTYGELWEGGPLPAISSPLYLPIADEIAERLDRPGDEIPQGDPWTVRIPTSLVHLRADDTLPVWSQNAQGEWVED
ncbi:MAG: hypothetical protein J0M09_15465 [Xanthomonadales bacterium]|nr:hypothetical protein [Xanthomonadales bacterium]